MDDELLKQIIDFYGLNYQELKPEQSGYRNHCRAVVLEDGRTINAILYKHEPNIVSVIRDANQVSDYLARQNLPSRQSIGKTLAIKTPMTTRYVSLYNYLTGETIMWDGYTKDHIKALGAMMSTMHATLRVSDIQLKHTVSELNIKILNRAESYFAKRSVTDALMRKLGLGLPDSTLLDCRKGLELAGRLRHTQPLHMDFVRGNVLFQQNRDDLKYSVSGVLDFEKTTMGHPIFDIARTIAFLLVDCPYKTPEKIYKYFLVSGYNKRGKSSFDPSSIRSSKLLENLIDWFLVYDFYKFLRHTPYESLPQNQHFLRTRDILISKKLLKYT